jgi:Asp-tRNA(Asn)/Glu-tRNA(Gln) amidotransferase A subunit family amidase
LRAARAEIVELDLPAEFDGLIAARRAIGNGEGRAAFLAEERLYGDRLHKDVRAMARNAASLDASTLRRAYDLAASSRAIFDEMASGFDAVLAPSAPGEAPIGLERTGEPVVNEMWTLLHVPCVTVPGFRGPSGLPVGVTLTGPRFADYQVLALAEQAATCFSAAL